MDRRSLLMLTGLGLLAGTAQMPGAAAEPPFPGAEILAPPVFSDEFDGPPGAPPDYNKWFVVPARETIRNPAFWDRPENMGQYRDDRQNLYLDGMGNLVIRATREGDRYFGAKIQGRQWIGIGHTWEARIKLECLTPGAWPAFWMLNDRLGQGGEIDVLEWFGNGGWGPGSTVHTRLDGTTAANHPIVVDPEWHVWRCQWDMAGIRFWKDPVPGMPPYFDVPAGSMANWRFNDPGFQMFPVLNLAVSGSGGGDPSTGIYPAQMLVDYIRVW
ncbi:putative beta-1,3-glucanase [Mycolicibacterium murale]|uniref:Putative beta-1,3-glucanase n=1 Tax=Mycolicibacterium murale TaxID=182220 RepID=A0A7I9WLW6_9MYCO|nr:putative beta-1,3-glucanase [Mycolicibacterium murale]